jgi:hypothetical protein
VLDVDEGDNSNHIERYRYLHQEGEARPPLPLAII